MAEKMCFMVDDNRVFEEKTVRYEYVKGLAFSQKQKNVLSFHGAIQMKYPRARILEVSTKSQTELGVRLSAFNLRLDGHPLECVYQSSKVFEGGISFEDLLYGEPKAAKKFIAENVKLPIVGFRYKGESFELFPKSMFYDYIYISALLQSGDDVREVGEYDIFTDIEFNEKKGVNCQARACAIYAYMLRNNCVEYYMSSRERFKEIYIKQRYGM